MRRYAVIGKPVCHSRSPWLHGYFARLTQRDITTAALSPQPPAAPTMWLTSPLRRYVDLANQRLLLASLQQQPPAKENWHQLRHDFDRQYALARRFQQLMDTHWALRILAAAPAARLAGSYLGKRRVRLADYPLTGLLQQPAAAGKKTLQVRVQAINLLLLQLSLTLAEGDP